MYLIIGGMTWDFLLCVVTKVKIRITHVVNGLRHFYCTFSSFMIDAHLVHSYYLFRVLHYHEVEKSFKMVMTKFECNTS